MDYRIPLINRPPLVRRGDVLFSLPVSFVKKAHEIAVTLALVGEFQLFGHCYAQVLPEYFYGMKRGSGLLIGPFVPSHLICKEITFPGDIDILVIPYESDELVLSRALAVEIKIIRASHAKQGRSPNEFGFSQAKGLLDFGFPYVAVGHLIVSDKSPRESWRSMHQAVVLDDTGAISDLEKVEIDPLAYDLIRRARGRLLANRVDSSIGVFAAYIFNDEVWLSREEVVTPRRLGQMIWMPEGARAEFNSSCELSLLDAIGNFYNQHYRGFIDAPMWKRSTGDDLGAKERK